MNMNKETASPEAVAATEPRNSNGHTGALFLSLLVYGAALTSLPRLKKAAE
jgi:hypothetical protein